MTLTKAVRFHEIGTPDVLTLEQVEVGSPKAEKFVCVMWR